MTKIKSLLIGIIIFITLGGCNKSSTVQIITPNMSGEGDKYLLAGEQAYQIGDYPQAINGYLKAIEAYTSSTPYDEKEVAYVNFYIGQCHTKLFKYKEAIEYFEKSLSMGEVIPDKELCYENYRYLLKVIVASSESNDDLKSAIEYGMKAEKAVSSLYGKKSPKAAEIYGGLGKAYLYLEVEDKAKDYMSRAIEIYGADSEESAIIYNNLADLYEGQEIYDEAEKILFKALKIFEGQNNIEWMANTHKNLGDFYHRRKNYIEALNQYEQGLELYEKSGQKDFTIANCYNDRGSEYYYLKEYDNFINDMKTAYRICYNLPKSELVDKLSGRVKENLKVYYDYNYEGDKSKGFDAWFTELISN